MRNEFASLYRRLCEPTTFDELQAIYRELKTIGDFNDELLAAMHEQIIAERWGCLCKLIWALPEPTPSMFTSLLCHLLDHHRHIEIMEAVADAMFSLRADKAVPSLVSVLDYELVGDADYHFNRKIIYALANIGSKDAIEGIQKALHSPEEIIRRIAKKELERI